MEITGNVGDGLTIAFCAECKHDTLQIHHDYHQAGMPSDPYGRVPPPGAGAPYNQCCTCGSRWRLQRSETWVKLEPNQY